MRGVAWLWLCVLAGLASGIAPLEDGRQRQVDTFVDGEHPDQPALYALLADVAAWRPGEQSGAVVADWDAIVANPEAFRGAAVLVEGMDAGRRRRVSLVRRQLPWGEAVTEWGVVVAAGVSVDADGGQPADSVRGLPREALMPVVVWFVDPGDAVGEAKYGRRVRLAGRFLGLWKDVDAHGGSRVYPVVVAKEAAVVAAGRATGAGPGPGWVGGLAATGGAVLVLGVLWRVSKAWGKGDVVSRRRASRRAATAGQTQDDDHVELPEQADAALAVLAEKHGSSRDESGGV